MISDIVFRSRELSQCTLMGSIELVGGATLSATVHYVIDKGHNEFSMSSTPTNTLQVRLSNDSQIESGQVFAWNSRRWECMTTPELADTNPYIHIIAKSRGSA